MNLKSNKGFTGVDISISLIIVVLIPSGNFESLELKAL